MDTDEQDEAEPEDYGEESLVMCPRFVQLALPVGFQLSEALTQWFPKQLCKFALPPAMNQ